MNNATCLDVLDQLEKRGYEPQDDAAAGQDWLDRRYPGATVRVILDDGEVRIVGFDVDGAWAARFLNGTPSGVIMAALDAAEQDAGEDDGYRAAQHLHEHHYSGQTLRHTHKGGDLPHGYYGHPEDAGSL